MTIPFDTTKPEVRPCPVTFFTDEDTFRWLSEQDSDTELGKSLIVHRIVKQAREASVQTDGEKRTGEDRRKSA